MRSRSVLPSLAGLLGALVCTGIASAAVSQASSGPRASLALSPHWTKISRDVGLGFASAGLLRTSDGRLHVIWPDDVANKYSLHYSTVGGNKLLATGTVVNSWAAMTSFPRLVPAPHGTGKPDLRVIFDGANGHIGSPYNLNTVYAATSSSSGTSWSLDPGSLSHSQLVPLTDDAATAEANGQPIAAWSSQRSVSYHVGIDPNTPAKTADTTIPVGADGAVIDPTLETDSSGRVWGAWFNSSFTSTMGYWADPILTGKSAMKKAPGSGGTNLNNAQPLQSVALAAREGGRDYLAYCVPTKTLTCSRIALWRVGAATAATVPGSAGGQPGKVAIAAAPGGHLWIAWFDFHSNEIHVVRTNAAATKFGEVETISPPTHLSIFVGLQLEGSGGPLDLVTLVQQTTPGSSPAFFDAQLFPQLAIHASPTTVTSSHATSIGFKVLDTGDPVVGATVSFLGMTGKTNTKGIVHLKVPKGTATGKHGAVASKLHYTSASVTIRVS